MQSKTSPAPSRAIVYQPWLWMSGLSDSNEGSLDKRRALLWREETGNVEPRPPSNICHSRTAEAGDKEKITGSLSHQDEQKMGNNCYALKKFWSRIALTPEREEIEQRPAFETFLFRGYSTCDLCLKKPMYSRKWKPADIHVMFDIGNAKAASGCFLF